MQWALKVPPPMTTDPRSPVTEPASGAASDRPSETREDTDLSAELRARLPERDPAALEAFFDLYFDRIYAYVRGMVRSEPLAEDLTQDIFLLLHRGLPSYDPSRALRPWVFTIAVNRVRDFWRSRAHRDSQREASIDEEDARELEGEFEQPDEPLLRVESAAAVRAAVEKLPDGMRETVHLRVFEGLSFTEIGELLGRNEVAVRKRYSRALEELRRLLGTTDV